MTSEVFMVQAAICSIQARIDHYLMSAVSNPPTGYLPNQQGTASTVQFTSFLNALNATLSAVYNWLINLLRTVTTLKEWKLKGNLGSGVLGLAGAEIELSFN